MTGVDQPDNAAHNALHFWQCPNCGQTHFNSEPPDMCAFCGDFTTWRLLTRAELRIVAKDIAQGTNVRYIQLPLPLIFYEDEDSLSD